MKLDVRTLLLRSALALSAATLAACGDDDGTGPDRGYAAPGNVVAAAQGASAIRLTWTAVTGATGYVVQRAAGTGAFSDVATPAGTTYDDTGLAPQTTYRYQVAAIGPDGRGDFSVPREVTTLGIGNAVADITADITASRTLHADTVYTLRTFVHVGNGATLTIQPGTTIRGTTGSALFVLRGAKIVADGTAQLPIVLTSDQAPGSRKPGDWGGLIILGHGIVNRAGQVDLEGTGSGASNPVVRYDGGTDNADSSGVLRYVRVEFAGFGVQNNQELNSFTFAGVGSRTKLEYLQSLAGLDDSFEWFGGAVDGRYLVSYESGDDHFDPSEGYVGRNQFLIAYQDTVLDPRAGAGLLSGDPQGFEIDNCGSATGSGCTLGYNSTPLTIPMFANFTLVGTGNNPRVTSTGGGVGMVIRRGAGGYFVNGIVARWPKAALSLRDAETQVRIANGELVLSNISVVETGTATGANAPIFESGSGRFTIDASAAAIDVEAGTVSAAAIFAALPPGPTDAASLDWSLATDAAARAGGTGPFTGALATKAGSFVTGTTYRGAADPDAATRWWAGWTTYARN